MIPRTDYGRELLDEEHIASSPIDQLRRWIGEAHSAKVTEPDAMCLSTVGKQGRPSSRFVLLRGLDDRGLVFFTNYESRKGDELTANPWAAIAFWWGALERQVRVEGHVERASTEESDAYFYDRPPESRLSAAASPQSRPIDGREELEKMVEELRAAYPTGDVPRPPHWGGFRLLPDRFEFWQGRSARLHDRLVYERYGESWRILRLAP